MTKMMDTVAALLIQTRRESIARASDKEDAIEWHEQIYDAVRQGEVLHAKELLTAHLVSAEKMWEKDQGKSPADTITRKSRAKK